MQSNVIEAIPVARVVDNFSVHMNQSEENRLYAGVVNDFSGLDFSKHDLRVTCFVGANP